MLDLEAALAELRRLGDASAILCDIREPAQVSALVEEALRAHGRPAAVRLAPPA